ATTLHAEKCCLKRPRELASEENVADYNDLEDPRDRRRGRPVRVSRRPGLKLRSGDTHDLIIWLLVRTPGLSSAEPVLPPPCSTFIAPLPVGPQEVYRPCRAQAIIHASG